MKRSGEGAASAAVDDPLQAKRSKPTPAAMDELNPAAKRRAITAINSRKHVREFQQASAAGVGWRGWGKGL